MSRLAWFDCAAGASGDMVLGALLDLGLPLDALRAELGKLPLGGYRLESRKVDRCGIQATKVDVVVDGEGHRHPHDHGQGGGQHQHHHGHRGLHDILHLLGHSSLDAAVKDRSAALFRRLAEAEAGVHGVPVEAVHFHEVGAVDSIVDVVGAVIGLHWLGAARFVASPLNVGSGTVEIAHGTYPVPPPATARLVEGAPVYGAGDGELLTPTGALLVTGHATSYGPLPPLVPRGSGYGAGSRDTPGRPNVLRIVVGDEAEAVGGDRVLVLECELDDTSPQILGVVMERLFAEGALDVFYTAVQMKKGRPGVLLSVLAPPARREAIEELLFRETTTLGVRRQEWERTTLARETIPVETQYGTVRVKVGRRGGRIYNAQPEFDDCLRAASGVPVKEVQAAALAAWRAHPASRGDGE